MTIDLKINGENVLLLNSIEFNYQLNRPSSISFTVDKYNYGNVFDLVELYENGNLVFKGKITKVEPDIYNQKTKLQAIESGVLKLMGKQINETFPKEDYDQQFNYYIEEIDAIYNLYIEINIKPQTSRTIYVYKMYGYEPSTSIDTSTTYTTTTYTQINDYVFSITINNSSTDTDITLIKLDVTNIIKNTNESLFIFDSSSYQRINETFYNYYIEPNDSNYNLWFKTSLPKKSKKRFIIEKGGNKNSDPQNVFEFFDNFDTLDTGKWNIVDGNWSVSSGNLISDETEGLISSNFLIDDKYTIYTKVKTESITNPVICLFNYENESNYDVLSELSYTYNEILTYQINNDEINSLNYVEENIVNNQYYELKISKNENKCFIK